jgi:hypothetical protein
MSGLEAAYLDPVSSLTANYQRIVIPKKNSLLVQLPTTAPVSSFNTITD